MYNFNVLYTALFWRFHGHFCFIFFDIVVIYFSVRFERVGIFTVKREFIYFSNLLLPLAQNVLVTVFGSRLYNCNTLNFERRSIIWNCFVIDLGEYRNKNNQEICGFTVQTLLEKVKKKLLWSISAYFQTRGRYVNSFYNVTCDDVFSVLEQFEKSIVKNVEKFRNLNLIRTAHTKYYVHTYTIKYSGLVFELLFWKKVIKSKVVLLESNNLCINCT